MIVDLVSGVLDGPSGTDQAAPDWAPLIETGEAGDPTGLDFSPTPQPVGQFRKAVLVEGDGAKVTKGQSVVARYLGQVYDAEKPFDQNYEGTPTAFALDGVVEGWSKALTGASVGSRIVIQIPPALGYGEAGNEQAGITGTDTLFFVVDVLAAG